MKRKRLKYNPTPISAMTQAERIDMACRMVEECEFHLTESCAIDMINALVVSMEYFDRTKVKPSCRNTKMI